MPVTDTLLVGLGSSYRAVRTEARRPSLGLLLGPSPPAQVEFGKDRPLAAGSAQKHYPKTHSHRITGIVCHAGSGPRRAAGPRGGRCQCKVEPWCPYEFCHESPYYELKSEFIGYDMT